MLQRQDANTIAVTKKEAYVKDKLLNLTIQLFKQIRCEAYNMNLDTKLVLDERDRFMDEIIPELVKIIEDLKYDVRISKNNSLTKPITYIHISWKE
jgi:uncharacterized protein YdiU (UPF0061 family)